jgi:predicted nucleic acid-binding Zn ribbon protein
MGQKQCEKCGEMADEAKAFCPACGNAFVEEKKRQEESKFEKLDHTVQFGQTMYNQMLEDMGLDISSLPKPAKKSAEIITVVPEAETNSGNRSNTVQEVARPAAKRVRRREMKWYILIALAVIVLMPLAVASTVLIVLQVLSRLR